MNSLQPPAIPSLRRCGRTPHRVLLLSGGPGAVDRERGFDSGGQRPVLSAAEEPGGAHPQLHHPADLPLHLREQAHGHHRAGKGCVCPVGQSQLGQPARDPGLTWAGLPAQRWPQSPQEGTQAGLGYQQSARPTPSLGSTQRETLGRLWNVKACPRAGMPVEVG